MYDIVVHQKGIKSEKIKVSESLPFFLFLVDIIKHILQIV